MPLPHPQPAKAPEKSTAANAPPPQFRLGVQTADASDRPPSTHELDLAKNPNLPAPAPTHDNDNEAPLHHNHHQHQQPAELSSNSDTFKRQWYKHWIRDRSHESNDPFGFSSAGNSANVSRSVTPKPPETGSYEKARRDSFGLSAAA